MSFSRLVRRSSGSTRNQWSKLDTIEAVQPTSKPPPVTVMSCPHRSRQQTCDLETLLVVPIIAHSIAHQRPPTSPVAFLHCKGKLISIKQFVSWYSTDTKGRRIILKDVESELVLCFQCLELEGLGRCLLFCDLQLFQLFQDCCLIVKCTPLVVDGYGQFIYVSIWMGDDENDKVDHVNSNKLCLVVVEYLTVWKQPMRPPRDGSCENFDRFVTSVVLQLLFAVPNRISSQTSTRSMWCHSSLLMQLTRVTRLTS